MKMLALTPKPRVRAGGGWGPPGPVVNQRATLTNVTFEISAEEIASCDIGRARLLNDLEAMGHSVEVLTPAELLELQPGTARPDGVEHCERNGQYHESDQDPAPHVIL